jgi:capsular exopolysaccharide synthesis family protein
MGELPVLTEMTLRDGKPSPDSRFLPTLSQPRSPTAEAIRALRTHTMARHLALGRRAIVVCAASADSGCTFVAANLAVALAQGGSNTLLIDADLRNPGVGRIFRRPSAQGLQQYLEQPGSRPGDLIEPNVLPNLSVLFAGGAAANPEELLAGSRFDELVDFCLREFDATIIDTPPANSSSDIGRICSVATYCAIVARRNKTFVNDVKLLTEQLRADGAQIIGTVLCQD